MGLSIGQYIVSSSKRKGFSRLSFSRDFVSATTKVMSQDGVVAAAAAYVRGNGNASLRDVVIFVDGQDHPDYELPSSILLDKRFAFRTAKNGKAMAQRIAGRKVVARQNRTFQSFLATNKISF